MKRIENQTNTGQQGIFKSRRSGRGSAVALLALVILMPSIAAAVDETHIRRATKPAGAIRLSQNRAVEIECRRDVARIGVGNPDLADIMLVPGRSPRLVRIMGKAAGSTNLIVWFGEGEGLEYELLIDAGYRVEVIKGTATDPEGSLKGW